MTGKERQGIEMLGALRRIVECCCTRPARDETAACLARELSAFLDGWLVGVALHEGDSTALALAPDLEDAGPLREVALASLAHTFSELSGMSPAPGYDHPSGHSEPSHLAPVMIGDRVAGLLATPGDGGGCPDHAEHALFLTAELLGPALALRAAWGPLVYRDSLTGLRNRRWLEQELGRVLASAQRRGQEASIVMLDPDGFKAVNDRLGHAEGDRLLCRVASTLVERIRREDAVCRYGGDEMVVLLPQTVHADAMRVAQRLAQPIEGITLSFGVAASGKGEETRGGEELLRCADRALLNAKKAREERRG